MESSEESHFQSRMLPKPPQFRRSKMQTLLPRLFRRRYALLQYRLKQMRVKTLGLRQLRAHPTTARRCSIHNARHHVHRQRQWLRSRWRRAPIPILITRPQVFKTPSTGSMACLLNRRRGATSAPGHFRDCRLISPACLMMRPFQRRRRVP